MPALDDSGRRSQINSAADESSRCAAMYDLKTARHVRRQTTTHSAYFADRPGMAFENASPPHSTPPSPPPSPRFPSLLPPHHSRPPPPPPPFDSSPPPFLTPPSFSLPLLTPPPFFPPPPPRCFPPPYPRSVHPPLPPSSPPPLIEELLPSSDNLLRRDDCTTDHLTFADSKHSKKCFLLLSIPALDRYEDPPQGSQHR